MSVHTGMKEKNIWQESEMEREETEKKKKKEDDGTAQVSEESVKETQKVIGGEGVKEENEVEQRKKTVDGDLEASKHTLGVVQESVVETATNVELVKETGVEGRDAVEQELTCVENMEEIKDIQQETVQVKFAEKACMEETKQGKQEVPDVEDSEGLKKANVKQIKEMKPAEAVVKETTGVEETPILKEVDVEEKAVTVEEVTYEEQGEKESKTGVGEAALKCSPNPHTLPSPQNDETENGSDLESFNFEDFEVVDAFEEEEEEVGTSRDKTKTPSSTSRRREHRSRSSNRRDKPHQDSYRSRHQHHSHSSHSKDRLKRGKGDAKGKSGSSSRSSRTSSRHRKERSQHGHSRDFRRKDEDRSSNKHRQHQKSLRKSHERDKTQARKRSPENARSSNRARLVSDKQSPSKDTSSSKKDSETATQSHSRKPTSSPNTRTSRRQMTPEAKGSSSTSHDATKQEKSGTEETSQGCNTPLGSDGSLGCELKVTCLDRNMEKAEDRGNGSIEKKEEEIKSEIDNKEPQVNNKEIEVDSEKLKANDKEPEVRNELKLNIDEVQLVNKDLESEVKNMELESNTTIYDLTNKELKSDMELALMNTENKEVEANTNELESNKELNTNVKGSKTCGKQLEPQINESIISNIKSEPQTEESKENNKELEAQRESEPQPNKTSMNIHKSEPEELEQKMINQTLDNTEPEPSQELEMVIKQSKANIIKTPEVREEETSLQEATSDQEMGIGTRTRSARKRGVPVAAPKRSTRSQRKNPKVKVVDEAKKEPSEVAVDRMQKEVSNENTDKESKQVYKEEVCPQNIPLKETVKNEIVSEESKKSIPLKSTASEKTVYEDNQGNTLLKKTAEDLLCSEEKGNEDSKGNTFLPEECKMVDAEEEDKNTIKNKSSNALQEEGDRCIAAQETLEHCEKRKVLDIAAQENIQEGKPQTTQKENNENIPSEEDTPRTSQQEHPQDITQDQDKPEHFKDEGKLRDTQKKDSGDSSQHENSQECIEQDKQGNVLKSSWAEDKCEKGQNTIKEDKHTQANDDEKRNSSREDNHSKEDTDSREAQDIKSNKRPLESVEECAKRKRKDLAEGLSSTEHKKNEEKEKDECKAEGEIKEENDDEIKTQEAKTTEKSSKESTSKKVGRYSKVVVVGDARMSLLTTADIKEQLREVTQVIVVPNLTLEGVLKVVQREVAKEECSRGVLLLCLAGLHGTLVESRVPEECRAAGHSDMHEMVPATKDDSLDPKFPKQLAKLKRKLLEALGRGSHVLFFPVLPVDMTNYNAVAAKQHFDATGHKLEHLPEAGSLHYRPLRHYREAIDEVNGSSLIYVRLVRFEFHSKPSCSKFTDELLQDGFNPTLDLVERYIVPQLQRTILKHHTLRFQQVVVVGDACLGQVVRMQQQKGVEPCTFILQEEPGLRSLTPDSPAVKQLSGICDALILLTVSLKGLAAPTGDSEGEKAQCFLPHNPSEAFDNFLEEARRVDQMLHSATHHCTIITTPVIPFNCHNLTRNKAGKTSSCDKCWKTAKSVTLAIAQFSNVMHRKNALPTWDLKYELQRDKGDPSSSHQGSSLSSKVVQKAARTWEYFLTRCQAYVRTAPCVTITSVLQDPKVLSPMLPKARETSRPHGNYNRDREQTQDSHSRDREQTQSNHSRDKEQRQYSHSRDKEQTQDSHSRDKEQTHNSHSRNKEKTQDSHSRDKEQMQGSHSRDKEQTHNSHSRNKGQTHNDCSRDNEHTKDNHSRDGEQWRRSPSASACPALDDITSPASSISLDRHSNSELDNISTEELSFTPSPCPSSINSPEDFVDSSHDGSLQASHSEWYIKSLSKTSLPEPWRYSSTVELTPLGSPRMRLWSVDSRDRSSSPQRPWQAELDEPGDPFYQQGSYLPSRNSERVHSTHTYPSPDPYVNRDRSRSRSRDMDRSRSIDRIIKVRTRTTGRCRSRSHSPKKRLCGRRSRSVSPAGLPLSPKRKHIYRRSLSRSLSPLQHYRSISGGTSFSMGRGTTSRGRRSVSRGKRSISMGRRSASRSRRSISRGRRSVSRAKRSISRGRKSVSRDKRSNSKERRSISRDRRSISRGRRTISRDRRPISRNGSISRGKRSISRGRRSTSWGRKSISMGRRSISRDRKPISKGRRSISRGRRSISMGRRSISMGRRSISRGRRSVSRSRRSISRSKRSMSRGKRSLSRGRRSISRGRRSISRGRRSVSRNRRSISRGKRSVPRGRRGRSSSREQHNPIRLPVHTPSTQQEKARENMLKEALKTLHSIHEKECMQYRSNPSIHPDIGVEYRHFCDKKTQSILALGGDPTQYNIADEWQLFWGKRMEEIFLESWKIKKKQCLDLLDAHQKPPSPQPSFKIRHSSSASSSASFSSSPSSSISLEDQQRSSKKRKKRGRSSSLKGRKRKKKNQDAKRSPPSYPRDRQAERSSGISGRHDEKSPEDYTRVILPERGGRKEEDYPVMRIPDMVRAARQEEWNEKPVERQLSSPREMAQASMEGWGQNSIEKHYPNPLEMAQIIQQDRGQENRKQHQQSPPHQSPTHDESWHHTPKDTIRDIFFMDKFLCEASSVAEDSRAEHPGQHRARSHWAKPHRVEPHGLVQDRWLQLSSKKCVTVSSGSPEVAVSEAQRKQDSWEGSDSNMKEGNLKNAFTSHSEWYKEHPGWQEAHTTFASSQEGQAYRAILKLGAKEPASKVASSAPFSQARELDSHYRLDHTEGKPQEPHATFASSQEGQAYQGILKLGTKEPASKVASSAPSSQARELDSHNSLDHTEGNPQEPHSAHRSDQNSSESITQIFKSFAANMGDKTAAAKRTRHSHEDEVSSTTALDKNTKIDVVNVLEVLTHLGDKLGALCDPLKLVLGRAKQLQANSADPMAITNDQDSKLLLQMIQEKLQGILKDGELSIIKKVIVQEAEQRLSLLLDLHEQRSLTGNLNLTQLARHCLDMDNTSTVDFIRKVLQCQGHTHLQEQQLMKLYMAVKAEQLKVVGDHYDGSAAATAAATFTDNSHHQSHNNSEASLCPQLPGDSAGPLHGFSSALFLPQTESHASTSRYDSPPWRARQPCNEAAQSTHNPLDLGLQWETSSYPQEAVTGSSHSNSKSAIKKPSKAFPPSQPSTSRSWSPQCHTTVLHLKASPSTPSDPPQGTYREARYHQKAPKYMYKKPIRITLPKHQPQKSIIGANPLGDHDTDSEEYG